MSCLKGCLCYEVMWLSCDTHWLKLTLSGHMVLAGFNHGIGSCDCHVTLVGLNQGKGSCDCHVTRVGLNWGKGSCDCHVTLVGSNHGMFVCPTGGLPEDSES